MGLYYCYKTNTISMWVKTKVMLPFLFMLISHTIFTHLVWHLQHSACYYSCSCTWRSYISRDQ